MKGVTVFLTLFVVFLSVMIQIEADHMRQKMVMHTLECLPNFKLTKEELEKLLGKQFDNPTKTQQCLARCVLHRANFVVNGIINTKAIAETLLKDYSKEFVDDIIAACPYENGKKDCATVFKVLECYGTLLKDT